MLPYRRCHLRHRRVLPTTTRGTTNADRTKGGRPGGRRLVIGVHTVVDVHGGHRAWGLRAMLLRPDGVEGRYSGDKAATHPGDAALQRGHLQVKLLRFLLKI